VKLAVPAAALRHSSSIRYMENFKEIGAFLSAGKRTGRNWTRPRARSPERELSQLAARWQTVAWDNIKDAGQTTRCGLG
jgi:hypothetical protein